MSETKEKFGSQDSIEVAQIQGLHILQAGFVNNFSQAASSLLRSDLELRLDEIYINSEYAFNNSPQEPSRRFCLMAGAGAGFAWVDLGQSLAYEVLERLLGGDSTFASKSDFASDRPLTALERRLMQKIVSLAAVSLSKAFPAEHPLRFEASLGESADLENALGCMVSLRFAAQLGKAAGSISISLPLKLLKAHISERKVTEKANLEISAAIEDIVISSEELSQLAQGDILATGKKVDDEVIVTVGGLAIFAGRLGISNGKKAITITRRIQPFEAT